MFLVLLPRGWNWICMLLYDLFGNLPFILIQRYNRPRLVILLERQREVQALQAAKKSVAHCRRKEGTYKKALPLQESRGKAFLYGTPAGAG